MRVNIVALKLRFRRWGCAKVATFYNIRIDIGVFDALITHEHSRAETLLEHYAIPPFKIHN